MLGINPLGAPAAVAYEEAGRLGDRGGARPGDDAAGLVALDVLLRSGRRPTGLRCGRVTLASRVDPELAWRRGAGGRERRLPGESTRADLAAGSRER
jgi:hypothetical protein